ncbi:MAG: type II toxin-antitoxin system RelE/ParE family toxin [Isosphaeraceae bacterium]
MNYRVELTAQADADINRIYGDLSCRSPEDASRWYESLWDAVERLKTNPFTCGFAHEISEFADELRRLLFGPGKRRAFRALFVVREELVKIVAIRWPGERPIKPEDVEW